MTKEEIQLLRDSLVIGTPVTIGDTTKFVSISPGTLEKFDKLIAYVQELEENQFPDDFPDYCHRCNETLRSCSC